MRYLPTPVIVGSVLGLAGAVLLASANSSSAAQPPVGLGVATSFVVLAGSTVTNTGPSVLNGDLGLSPGTAIPGVNTSPGPATVNGNQHITDGVAAQAQLDLTTAYNGAAGRTPETPVPADLTGKTLGPGVYTAAPTLGLDRHSDPERPQRPGRGFHLQGGKLADHRQQQHGCAHRRQPVQRLLAGRQLRDAGHELDVRRHGHGADRDQRHDRSDGARSPAGTQRRSHPRRQHDQPAELHRDQPDPTPTPTPTKTKPSGGGSSTPGGGGTCSPGGGGSSTPGGGTSHPGGGPSTSTSHTPGHPLHSPPTSTAPHGSSTPPHGTPPSASTPGQPPTLARTGSDNASLAIGGALAIVVGGLLLLVTRRTPFRGPRNH